jgi:inward rectifier potassium channel
MTPEKLKRTGRVTRKTDGAGGSGDYPFGTRASIVVLGQPRSWLRDFYYWLLTTRWSWFLLFVLGVYILVNCVFGLLFWLDRAGIAHLPPGSFWDAFFFSTQTLTTLGSGLWYPTDRYSEALTALEPMIGLMGLALVTGVMFARVSRPSSRIRFSRHALITRFQGTPTLVFRLANSRHNLITGGTLGAFLIRSEKSSEGRLLRRIHELPLVRSHTPLFALTWLVMHEIRPDSPLAGCVEPESVDPEDDDTFILVNFTGHDRTFGQAVHAQHRYRMADLRWNRWFADVTERRADGRWQIDYERFDELVD